MTPTVLAVLSLVAWRSPDPITLAIIGELAGRIATARTPVEIYVATYDAVLYATSSLRGLVA